MWLTASSRPARTVTTRLSANQIQRHRYCRKASAPAEAQRPVDTAEAPALLQEPEKSPEDQARAEVTRRIQKLAREKKPKQAINELTNLARMGIQPDTMAATALVSACVANNNMDMAFNVFDELFGDFVTPDDVVFSVLIQGLGQASNPPDWEAVARLLTRMQKEFDVPITVTVYNSLLGLCAMSNDLVRAEELIDKMTLQGHVPDEQTLAALEGKRALRTALKRAFPK